MNRPAQMAVGINLNFHYVHWLAGMPVCEDTDLLDEQHLEKWDVDNKKEFAL